MLLVLCCYVAAVAVAVPPAGRRAAAGGDASSTPQQPPPPPWPSTPLPSQWKPTWQMNMSTVMMPCNVSGWFDARLAAKYGIVDFDWSNVRSMWTRDIPMDDAARLASQVARVKAVNPQTHTWVYRNLVKALSWYKDVGEKLSNPAYAGWFLHFREGGAVDLGNRSWHSPRCTAGRCSPLYHSQDQTPRLSECGGHACECGQVPCGEYIYDHRSVSPVLHSAPVLPSRPFWLCI
jgi:hypothetical protein